MLRTAILTAALAVTSQFALADGHSTGDAAEGEKLFNRCKSCHMIATADETFVKGGKTGPNLYGVIGRTAGSAEDFDKYGDSLVALGEGGFAWDEATLAEYVVDPRKFLQTQLDDRSARSKMAFKLRDGGADVAAYLATFSEEGS